MLRRMRRTGGRSISPCAFIMNTKAGGRWPACPSSTSTSGRGSIRPGASWPSAPWPGGGLPGGGVGRPYLLGRGLGRPYFHRGPGPGAAAGSRRRSRGDGGRRGTGHGHPGHGRPCRGGIQPGGCALAAKIAAGGYAHAPIAMGDQGSGGMFFDMHTALPDAVRSAILTRFPGTWKWIADLFSSVV